MASFSLARNAAMIAHMLLYASLLAVLTVGAILLRRGMRGRRVDDHPLCRRCGYDLTGRPAESARCAECGADLSAERAIVIGHRVRRHRPLVAGAALCTLALLVGIASFVPAIREFDPTPYKPTAWLIRDLRPGGPAEVIALAELRRRLDDGRLTEAHAQSTADRCLAVQADLSVQWDPAYGRFIESARAAGRRKAG